MVILNAGELVLSGPIRQGVEHVEDQNGNQDQDTVK